MAVLLEHIFVTCHWECLSISAEVALSPGTGALDYLCKLTPVLQAFPAYLSSRFCGTKSMLILSMGGKAVTTTQKVFWWKPTENKFHEITYEIQVWGTSWQSSNWFLNPHFQCRGYRFNPDRGTKIPPAVSYGQRFLKLQKLQVWRDFRWYEIQIIIRHKGLNIWKLLFLHYMLSELL